MGTNRPVGPALEAWRTRQRHSGSCLAGTSSSLWDVFAAFAGQGSVGSEASRTCLFPPRVEFVRDVPITPEVHLVWRRTVEGGGYGSPASTREPSALPDDVLNYGN